MIAVPIALGHIQNIKVCGMYIPFFFSYVLLYNSEFAGGGEYGAVWLRDYRAMSPPLRFFFFFFTVASWPAHEGSDMPEFLICDE